MPDAVTSNNPLKSINVQLSQALRWPGFIYNQNMKFCRCRAEPKVSNDAGAETEPVRIVPKPRSNPFGSARPREEVLREKG